MDAPASASVNQALFVNPTGGQPLDMANPVSWTPISNAQAYGLSIGTSRGANDLVNIGLPGTTTSFNVSMLPTERTLYARVWTEIGGAWVGYQDVTFTTMGQGGVFTSPTDGQTASSTR